MSITTGQDEDEARAREVYMALTRAAGGTIIGDLPTEHEAALARERDEMIATCDRLRQDLAVATCRANGAEALRAEIIRLEVENEELRRAITDIRGGVAATRVGELEAKTR